jgi:hypothetical protein
VRVHEVTSIEDVRNFLKALPLAVLLPLALAMVSVAPEDAISNFSKWAHLFGLYDLPGWLTAKSADYQVPLYILALSIIYAATVWGIPFYRKHRRTPRDGPQSVSSAVETPRSVLLLSVGQTGRYVSTRARGLYNTVRTFSVMVENDHATNAVSDCKLTLLTIEPQEYTGPWPIEEGFSLAAGDHRYVELVRYGEANDPSKSDYSDSFMEVLPAGIGKPKPSAGSSHILSLRATAIGAPPCDLRVKVWKGDDGRLQIQALGA